jgi:membrane-associated protease RseP (regulator of RpoE activity)
VTTFDALDASLADGAAELTILRGGERVDVTLEPWWLEAGGIDRVVGFAGALLHAPHAAVAAQRGFPREGVYVAWYWYGSPAARFGLRPTRRIVAVDGQPVADIDAFLAAVGARAAGDSVRLETVDLQGRREVLTLQLDPTYWPTYQLLAGEDGWRREDVR